MRNRSAPLLDEQKSTVGTMDASFWGRDSGWHIPALGPTSGGHMNLNPTRVLAVIGAALVLMIGGAVAYA